MIIAGWLVCGRSGPATIRRLIWAGYDAEISQIRGASTEILDEVMWRART